MSDHPFVYGIDFCFNVTSPGTPDPEGHYPLGFGFISRANENGPWTKVAGFTEAVRKNMDFGFQLFEMSQSIAAIDYVTIDFRPASDATGPVTTTSPFNSSDENKLRDGQTLRSPGPMQTRGCGDGSSTPNGNYFSAGQYTLKNLGGYELTVELRVTTASGQSMLFKCDPKMQVGT